jgi:hypothetical protein
MSNENASIQDPAQNHHRVALVIMLVFLLLPVGLRMAFFSRALTERLVTSRGARETKVELFAERAVETLAGDLKSEIGAGSTIPSSRPSPCCSPPILEVMIDERTQLLLQRYFDQVLTVEERNELSAILLASPREREEFWELARWNALIRQWGEAEWGRRDAEGLTSRLRSSDRTQPWGLDVTTLRCSAFQSVSDNDESPAHPS